MSAPNLFYQQLEKGCSASDADKNYECMYNELLKKTEELATDLMNITRKLEKYKLVVRSVEALCGQKIIDE